jgi:hypothetical protein
VDSKLCDVFGHKLSQGNQKLLFTHHEMIPARNASLAAIYCSASGSNIRYYPKLKHSPIKERNEQGCYDAQTARCLQLGCEPLRLFIADQLEVFRPLACSVLPPHCTKDVYTPQESTRDLWTVSSLPNHAFFGRYFNQVLFSCVRIWGSSVSIVSGYRLDDRVSIPA